MEELDSPQNIKTASASHKDAPSMNASSLGIKRQLPLNTLGTQFALPSQIDPDVLKELPSDISNRLLQGRQEHKDGMNDEDSNTAGLLAPRIEAIESEHVRSAESRSPSSTPTAPAIDIPRHSQIDKATLEALPEDVRSEVLAYYTTSPSKTRNQSVLPQSPRKDHAIKLPKKLITPTKRRGRPLGGGGLKASAALSTTLTQSNFVANQRALNSKDPAASIVSGLNSEEISADFLSALPEDIKHEVLAQARRDRLQKHAGLDLAAKRRRPAPNKSLPTGQRTLNLSPRPPKPTFTSMKFASLPDLRSAISAWYNEFRHESPYEDDITLLIKYLKRVITDEGDMAKAVNVVKWLRWNIDEGGGIEKSTWRLAMSKIEQGVQDAVKARGLGVVDFS